VKAMAITRAMAAIILIVAMFMIFPILVALIEGTPEYIMAFVWPAAAAILASSGILLATWNHRGDINPKSGFLLVTLGWIAVSAVSALPFVIGGAIPSYTDAFFETMSGFTTTGASILTAIENVPRPFLFWRSLTHWLGGMGIVVLAVALFPCWASAACS
jgi:trk system potassium uptake protein TrkH